MILSSRPLRVAVVLTAAVGLAACGGHSSKKSTSSTPAPTASTSASTTPAPSTPAATALNPYTGIGPVPTTPTIAVKIDDTPPGRPQVGIDKADIVFVEAVEGGLTRLAAVFGTTMPTAVGYVRSTRPADPDLLLQFGKITEAYSGGAHDSLPRVKASGITSWSNDAGAPYYSRISRSASDYINLALNLKQVAAKTKSPAPKNMGWTFAASLAGLTTSAGTDVKTRVTGSYPLGSGTAVEFRYNAKMKKYIRYIDGAEQFAADGKPIAMTNVVVQSCKIVSHPEDTDVNGNPSQFTYTVGTGAVSVFRGGKRINGTWTRKTTADGTTLTTAGGTPLPLSPGNSWVVLVRTGETTTGS